MDNQVPLWDFWKDLYELLEDKIREVEKQLSGLIEGGNVDSEI